MNSLKEVMDMIIAEAVSIPYKCLSCGSLFPSYEDGCPQCGSVNITLLQSDNKQKDKGKS